MRAARGPAGLGVLALLLGGCAHEVGFDASYVSHRQPDSAAAGKLLLIMPSSERDFVYTGAAQSPRGGGHTVTIPVGAMITEIATVVLGRCFEDGVVLGEEPAAEGYALAVDPDLVGFVYRYVDSVEQDFAEAQDPAAGAPILITPEIEVGLAIAAYDSARRPLLQKTYRSGTVTGESYFVSNAPYEEVNKALHTALHTLMMQAASDINGTLDGACDLRDAAAPPATP